MTGLEIVGASALYLGGLYASAITIVGVTSIVSPRLESLIVAGFVAMLLGGVGVVAGLIMLGMLLVGG